MLARKFTALALASVILVNCASTPGEEDFCSRNTALCIIGGVVVVAAVIVVAAGVAYATNPPPPAWSDARLKRDIEQVDTLPNGLKLYSFRYWNDDRIFVSVMAQDLIEDSRFRHAVTQDESGYYTVDLAALGLDVAGSREALLAAGRKAAAVAIPVAY